MEVVFSTVLKVLNYVWPILVSLILFGMVVFIHEFGHFIFAKLFKVKVNEFSLGFGPKIFSKKGKSTLYSLRALPLGGYCAMEGEDQESDDEGAFSKKRIWKRILIVFAGGFFNLLLGLLLVTIYMTSVGVVGTTYVAEFPQENSKSYECGLRVGDEIVSINGRRTYTASDISYMLTSAPEGKIDVEVIRDGERLNLDIELEQQEYEGTTYHVMDFKILGYRNSSLSIFTNIKYILLEFLSFARLVWMSLFDLITGRYGLNQLMGPVGLVSTVGEAVSNVFEQGFEYVLYLLSLITINLGLVNLLPLPALDGGRIFLLLAQGITRKKIPEKYEAIVHGIGFAILMGFIIVITFNDILRFFR